MSWNPGRESKLTYRVTTAILLVFFHSVCPAHGCRPTETTATLEKYSNGNSSHDGFSHSRGL